MYSFEEVTSATLKYFKGDDLATSTWIAKYCLRDLKGNLYELTPDDMHKRIAGEFARIESQYPNSLSETQIYEILKDFKYIIPQGSPMEGIGNNNKYSTLSNCYVISSPRDSYTGILFTEREMIELYKRRGGVGTSLHTLRSKSMPTSSVSEKSSGVCLFAERYSNATREVAQDGRRGALMLSLRIDHPDSELFIDSKLEDGKITGANISVMIDDKFMEAVQRDGEYELSFVGLAGEDKRVIKAKKLWNKIIHNAWKSAEPGILFWDTILKESPANKYGKQWIETSTNPCFSGDTIIAVADGRNGIKIKDLAGKGKFPVYSAKVGESTGSRKVNWKAEIKNATAFQTGIKKVIEVKLSDGSTFKCTPEHLLALDKGGYIEAKNSVGMSLAKFYSFSNKNSNKCYRTINSKLNGYSRQYRMMWEFENGAYDGKLFNIDHIDGDAKNDKLTNLQLISNEEHKIKSSKSKEGLNNPIFKVNEELVRLDLSRKNIFANASRYNWSKERLEEEVEKWDAKNKDRFTSLIPEDKNVNFDVPVFVESISECGEEPVYDLNVPGNDNFYIITKTDDNNFLNSSGVLVHNCSELPLPPYDSCRLLLLNLYSYAKDPFTKNASFDLEKFKKHIAIAQRLMDDIIDLELEKIDRILDKIINDNDPDDDKSVEINLWKKIRKMASDGRRTGLGVTAEGDMLAAMGFVYGTNTATDFSEFIHRTLAVEAYKTSIDLAEERGCFPIWGYDIDLREDNVFVHRIHNELSLDYQDKFKKFGRRNIALLTIAPAGSVSILSQTTSGVEPLFMPFYKRRKKTNDPNKSVFKDGKGDYWEEYNVIHDKFRVWYNMNKKSSDLNIEDLNEEQLDYFYKLSPYYKATSQDVDYLEKVRMQGKIQRWVDHSISVTVNMPENVTEDVVSQVYFEAWKNGCKGITVYREGSRSGVLISQKKKVETFEYVDSVKIPKELDCDIYHKRVLGEDMVIVVGKLQDGKPIEIFSFKNKINLPDRVISGKRIKVKKRHYKLIGEHNGKEYVVENIIDLLEENEINETRKVSLELRHKIDPRWIVEQYGAFATISGVQKAIERTLKLYINQEETVEQCPECKVGIMVKSEGCEKCPDCGYAKCG
jgi:ribonucleotide reductase alpha subunit